MNITKLNCTGCGAQITPDWEKGTGTCAYCGNVFVLEKDIVFRKSNTTGKDQKELTQSPNPQYVSWRESGFADHAMDWQDDALEAAMRKLTGIEQGDIMLSNVFKLTSLKINESGIENVDALNELTNLQSLILENNYITDISGLTNLKNLTFLNLYKNRVSNIGGIAYMPLLRDVRLDYNMVSDLTPLADLKYIERLYVYMNQVTDVSPIGNLISLKDLRIDFNPVKDISSLAGLTKLESLNLEQTNVENLAPVMKLESLKDLRK